MRNSPPEAIFHKYPPGTKVHCIVKGQVMTHYTATIAEQLPVRRSAFTGEMAVMYIIETRPGLRSYASEEFLVAASDLS